MDQNILMLNALPAALVGFVTICTQRTKDGMIRRAVGYLLMLLLISSVLTFISSVLDPEVQPRLVQAQLLKNILTAALFFSAAWLSAYLVFFRKSLEDVNDM